MLAIAYANDRCKEQRKEQGMQKICYIIFISHSEEASHDRPNISSKIYKYGYNQWRNGAVWGPQSK